MMTSQGSRNNSREPSRNTSPIRKDKPPSLSTTLSTQPSAAALQRALSASNVQQLQYQQPQSSDVSDVAPRKPREAKSASASGQNTPQWPVSPRLKSPPPAGLNSRRGSSNTMSRKVDSSAAPSINVQNATPQSSMPSLREIAVKDGMRNDSAPQLQPPPKAPSRGPSGKSTLETVQENSSDAIAEPSPAAIQASADLKPLTKISDDARSVKKAESDKQAQPGESGSESAGNKSDPSGRPRRSSVTQPANSGAHRSKNSSLKGNFSASAKRHSEGKQGMTVETEVVQSIPQAALTAGERSTRNESGSVRLKPSTETIRPKKERKKNDRKARSVNQGTATSKADLFEARVASAVDEANTSDSDETFVYESNPPEQQRRQRHHSRTPSVTSSHSMATEQRNGGIRSFGDTYEDRRVGGKRSMKFSSNQYNEVDSPDSKDGTVRTHTPRHIGRYGRSGQHLSASHDKDSPFTQASKSHNHHLSAQAHSRPGSPRSPQSMQYRSNGLFGKKPELSYEFDAEQNADDEQTPLIGSMRSSRGGRYVRHIHSGVMHPNSFQYGSRPRRWVPGKSSARLLTTLVVVLVIISTVGFAFTSNRPLRDVEVQRIENVLASRQELIFDLLVSAVNPNTLGISVNDMDLTVFAKTKHVSDTKSLEDNPESEAVVGTRQRLQQISSKQSSSDYNPNPSQDLSGHWHAPSTDDHDHGTDPDGDKEIDSQTMLLGRVYEFDQPLSFEASPIKQHVHRSKGQLRLMRPGNKTEAGGSERWEHIIQYPFELIVRGVLKYQLPISARMLSASISSSVMVHPEDGIDRNGNMRTTPVDHSDHWQWIDWPEERMKQKLSEVEGRDWD